jgi:hypothetical protein
MYVFMLRSCNSAGVDDKYMLELKMHVCVHVKIM